MLRWAVGLLGMVLLLGCIPALPEPTATPSLDPTLAPSPTVLPMMPTEPPDAFIGRSNPTAAALAAEGQPSVEPPDLFAPLPTEQRIPLTVFTGDGVRLHAEFYGAPQRPAPALLLVPGEMGIDEAARDLSAGLSERGLHVMLLQPRGLPPSGGAVDGSRLTDDARAALRVLDTLPDINGVAGLGMGQGALSAALACQSHDRCAAGVVWYPLPDESGQSLEEQGAALGALPVLLRADEQAPVALASAQLLADHTRAGTLHTEAAFGLDALVEWLRAYLGG